MCFLYSKKICDYFHFHLDIWDSNRYIDLAKIIEL
jgi:hypothetical protein